MKGKAPARAPGRPRNENASRAITEAALCQLGSLGYGHVTMDSVAAEAGVSRATLYRRYKDKADLVTSAIATTWEPDRSDPVDNPRQALVAFLEQFDERFAETCLEVIGGLVGARDGPEPMAMHRERVVAPRAAYAMSLLEEARSRGELAADADLPLALQMLGGSVLFRRVSGDPLVADWAERAVDAVWAGMGTVRGRDQV